jgi:hypothetical protein
VSSNGQASAVIVFSQENFTVITNVWITNAGGINDLQNHGKVEHRRDQRGRERKQN